MKKYLSLLTVLVLGSSTTPLINHMINNDKSTKLIKNLETTKTKRKSVVTNNQVNFLAAKIMGQVLENNEIDGSNFSASLPASLCKSIIFDKLLSRLDDAVSLAKKIPLLGQLVVEVILASSINNIEIINPNQKLNEGQNKIPTSLNFDGETFSSTANLINVQKKSNDPTQIAQQIMAGTLASSAIDGSSLNSGLSAITTFSLISKSFAGLIEKAILIAGSIPVIGELVVKIILNLSTNNIEMINPNQKLTEGNNQVPVNLDILGDITKTNLNMTNVGPESTDPTQIAQQIMAGTLASSAIDSSSLSSGLPVQVIMSLVPDILTNSTKLALSIINSLPSSLVAKVSEIIKGLNISNIQTTQFDQKLTEGNNQVPVNLDILGNITKTNLNMMNVGPESTDPTQIAQQIISGALASSAIDGSSLTQGTLVSSIIEKLLSEIIGNVISQSLYITSLLGSTSIIDQVSVIIKGLNISNIQTTKFDQKLTEGNNQVPVNLDILGDITKTNLTITGVQKE